MNASDDVITEFREAFRLDDLTIRAHQGWSLSVRPGQLTLGSMVISSTAGHRDFQALSTEEAAGLVDAIAVAERLAKEEFGAARINVVCLMMKDPIVHFHVVPRYSQPLERYGRTWTDGDWPGPPTFGSASTSEDVLSRIREDLGSAL